MNRVAGDATQILTEALYEAELWQFPPSLVAAAVLFAARRKVGAWPFWPQALAMLTGGLLHRVLWGCAGLCCFFISKLTVPGRQGVTRALQYWLVIRVHGFLEWLLVDLGANNARRDLKVESAHHNHGISARGQACSWAVPGLWTGFRRPNTYCVTGLAWGPSSVIP